MARCLAVVAVFPQASCGGDPPVPNHAQIDQATALVVDLVESRVDEAISRFDDELRTKLTAERLDETWKAITQRHGQLAAIKEVWLERVGAQRKRTDYHLRGRFVHGELDIRVRFVGDGLAVSDLWFGAPATGPKPEPLSIIFELPKPPPTQPPEGKVWIRRWPELTIPEDRPLRAAILIVDGVYNTELVAPYDVFDHVRYQAKPGIDVFTVSPGRRSVTTAEGLRIHSDYSLGTAPSADILIVPSAEHSRDTDLDNAVLVGWVKQTAAKSYIVMSLCWGAFVLAEAGLLDGKDVTTFPSSTAELARRFPEARVNMEASFVHDGKLITSRGGVRSFEAAMYVVDHLYGTDVATAVGKGLVIDWPSADLNAMVIE